MRRRSNPGRYLLSIVLAFMLSLSIFLTATAVILHGTLFNEEYHVRAIETSGFARAAISELDEIFTSYANASGVPPYVLDANLNEKLINTAAAASVRYLFDTRPPYNFKGYQDLVYRKLMEFVGSGGYAPDADEESGLELLASMCADALEAHTKSAMHERVIPYLVQVRQTFNYILIGMLIATAALILAIAILNRKRLTHIIHYLCYSLCAATLFCLPLPIAAYEFGALERLGVTPVSFNRLLSRTLSGIVDCYIWAALILLPVLIACLIARHVRVRRRRRVYP